MGRFAGKIEYFRKNENTHGDNCQRLIAGDDLPARQGFKIGNVSRMPVELGAEVFLAAKASVITGDKRNSTQSQVLCLASGGGCENILRDRIPI